MASYTVEWKKSAVKELRSLPPPVVLRVIETVEALSMDPFPAGCRKLKGSDHTFRIRIGDYRAIYEVFDTRLVIEVIRVRHRKDAYR